MRAGAWTSCRTDEYLNQHWFLSLDEARAVTEAWREDCNRVRPHGALGNRTPSEFARPVAGHAQLPALRGTHLGWYQDGGGVIEDTPRDTTGIIPEFVVLLQEREQK